MAMDDDGNTLLLTTFQNPVGLTEIGIDMGDIIFGVFIDDGFNARLLTSDKLMLHGPANPGMGDGIGVLEINQGFHRY